MCVSCVIATRIDRSATPRTPAGAGASTSSAGILPQDRPLQLLERRARIDPELVDESPARLLVGVQRFCLPTRPIERRHQIHPQALTERVLGDQCLELSDQLVVAPEREVGVDPQLQRCQPDLLEPGDRRLGEALVDEVRERWSSPQSEGVAEPLRRIGRKAASQQASSLRRPAARSGGDRARRARPGRRSRALSSSAGPAEAPCEVARR